MSSHYRRRIRRRQRGCACFQQLVTLLALTVLLAGLFLLVVRPRLGDFVGRQLARPSPALQGQIEGQIAQGLPGLIAALPPGEVSVTETQVNSYIAANMQQIEPLDAATVRFAPGLVEADIAAFGSSSRARADLAVQEGQLVLRNPQIDGPLNLALSAESLAGSLEQQINAELAAQGQSLRELRVEQGQVVLVTE